MAKVFGAEGSGFVSEEKKKNGSYLGKKQKGRDSFVSEWKRRKKLCLCKRTLCCHILIQIGNGVSLGLQIRSGEGNTRGGGGVYA